MRLPLLAALLCLGVAHISCIPVATVTEASKESDKSEATQGISKAEETSAQTEPSQPASEKPKEPASEKPEEPKPSEVEQPKTSEAPAQETTKTGKDKVTGRQSDGDDDDDDDDLDLGLEDDDDSDDDDDYLGGIFDDILGGMLGCWL